MLLLLYGTSIIIIADSNSDITDYVANHFTELDFSLKVSCYPSYNITEHSAEVFAKLEFKLKGSCYPIL
jgi:hypothetical protein